MYINGEYYLNPIENYNIYKRALNGGDFGILEWNINKEEMFISEKIEEITGYKFNYIKNMAEFINIIYMKKIKQ